MRNVEMKVEGEKLHIEVDLSQEGEVSSSGKSLVIGTTKGNVPVEGRPDVMVGLNVYTKKK